MHFCVAIELVRKAAVVAIAVRVSGVHGLRLHGFKKETVDRSAPFCLQGLPGVVDGLVLGRGIHELAEVEDCQEQGRVDSKRSARAVDVVESGEAADGADLVENESLDRRAESFPKAALDSAP